MAKTRKTRSSASTTEPTPEPILPTSPESEPTPKPEQNIETMETEQTTVSEPVENQEEANEAVIEENGEENEAVIEENGEEKEAVIGENGEEKEAVIEENGGEKEELNEAVIEENGEEKEETNEAVIEENGDKKEEEELEEESVESLMEPFTKDQLILLIKQSISKHSDIIENVNKLADFDPSHRKIFVHGLGYDSTVETLTSIFQQYGELEDCKLVKDKITGKSKGYAFILFKKRKAARLALNEPQKLIGGRMTSSQLASAGPVSNVGVGNQLNEQNVSELTLRKIFVSNVGAETDTGKLVEFFAKFGEIEDGPLGLDKSTGKPRGFCLFVYKNVESVKKVLVEPHKSFEGQMLHCQQAVDGPRNVNGKGGSSSNFAGNMAKRGRYNGGGGHLMAPSARPMYNNSPVVAPEAIGQAFAALLAQSAGGYGNMMNNVGYGGQSGGYGVQPGYQGGYGGQQQMGQGGVWPYQGGAPYMGHGR